MVDTGELQALTHSIGEHALMALGLENIAGMQATLNPTDLVCILQIALRVNSGQSQLDAIAALGDVEDLFFNEAVISFQFVDEIMKSSEPARSPLQYSYS
jgi:hypothetical protein